MKNNLNASDAKPENVGEHPPQPLPLKRKKGVGIMALFAAGVVVVAVLFGTGLSIQQSILTGRAQNIENLPVIQLEEPPAPEGVLSTTELVAKVVPSVVSIDIYEEKELEVYSSGSGIIFSDDGYIVTNAHVVEDAFSIRVILDNGEGYTATLVGQDVRNDLAVIKIVASDLVPAEFGDSEKVQIGERAIAIGNAAGIFPGSPTQGIISGVNRELPLLASSGETMSCTLLQTDAAINPGNSGGALINMYGQVIGVNVAKLYSIGIDNIGFAIPTSVMQPVVEQILQVGEIPAPPVLGVVLIELNETNGPSQGLPSSGLYIEDIAAESDLARCKEVRKGDIIVGANGEKIETMDDLTLVIGELKVGDTVELEIYRPDTADTVTLSPKLYKASMEKAE